MKPDAMIVIDMVTANEKKNRPTTPPMNRIGMNTAHSEQVIDSTVKLISRAPRMAASNGSMPCST